MPFLTPAHLSLTDFHSEAPHKQPLTPILQTSQKTLHRYTSESVASIHLVSFSLPQFSLESPSLTTFVSRRPSRVQSLSHK